MLKIILIYLFTLFIVTNRSLVFAQEAPNPGKDITDEQLRDYAKLSIWVSKQADSSKILVNKKIKSFRSMKHGKRFDEIYKLINASDSTRQQKITKKQKKDFEAIQFFIDSLNQKFIIAYSNYLIDSIKLNGVEKQQLKALIEQEPSVKERYYKAYDELIETTNKAEDSIK